MKKEIIGYNGYYVDENGNIYGKRKEVLMPVFQKKTGYNRISLVKDGKAHNFSIHRIVAEMFIENPLNLPQVNHKNGIKTDNRVENLEWVSRSENQLHKIHVLGKGLEGERNPQRKLTKEKVLIIYQMAKNGVCYTEISKQFGISRSVISGIKNGKNWNNVTGEPVMRKYRRWTTLSPDQL